MTEEQERAVIAAVKHHGVVGIRDDDDGAQQFVDMAKWAWNHGLRTPAIRDVLGAAGIDPEVQMA